MKKLFLILVVLCLIPNLAYSAVVDTRVTANTVSYNTISFADNRGPQIISFNAVTNHIRLTNLSRFRDCYADIRCVDSNGTRGYATNLTTGILLPAIGNSTPNTVEFDFATRNIAFRVDSVSTTAFNESANNLQVNYVVTGDSGNF